MSPLLTQALEEARDLAAERGWVLPGEAALAEAERLLAIVKAHWRAPTSVQVEPDGAITLEWDAGAHGWLQLGVQGTGQLAHSAVIEGDEYAQSEAFDSDGLPGWADALLRKLLLVGH
jgi:hypothetical protein